MNIFLKKLIDQSEIISFDIYDTLIKRNCDNPQDIFEIVEKRYNSVERNKIQNFKKERILAEQIARKETDKEDITLEYIYSFLNCYKKNVKDKLKSLEIQTEFDYSVANFNFKSVYDYCKSNNKKMICISDMYLPSNILEEILKNNGMEFDMIFVSGECGYTKYSGNLFKLVIEKLNVYPNSILHIGDRKRPDFLNPILNGMKSYKIKNRYINVKRNEYFTNNINLDKNIIYNLINNNILKEENSYSKLGYEVFGPLCVSFLFWMNKKLKDIKVDNILFCARDMKLIMDMYNLLYKDNCIKNEYFYVSRKSVFLPYLYKNNNYNSFYEIAEIGKRSVSFSEMLNNIKVAIPNNKVLDVYDIDINEKYDLEDLKNNSKFKDFYDNYIYYEIDKNGKEQYEFFLKYLDKLKMSNKTAIVDLGWNATTQNMLINILGYDLYGFYFGIYSKKDKINSNNCFSIFFDENEKDYSKKLFSFRPLFEVLFSAQHGSTISYTNNIKMPVILGENYNKDNKILVDIQKGALDFAADISNIFADINDFDGDFYFNKILNMGICPSIKDAKLLGNLENDNFPIRKFAVPKKIHEYILNPSSFKKDFTSSEWKIGFVKNLFKLNLPYYYFYNKIRKDD